MVGLMSDTTPPGDRPEFVLPKPKRMTPWVKALVILSLALLLLFGGCMALIAGLGKVSIYKTVQVVWLGL
jgi:hypothetical protein